MIYVDRHNLKIQCSERVICRCGDNALDRIVFKIGESPLECRYVLYIAFSDGSINSVLLENGDDQTAVWNVKAEHVFTSGIAYIQIKAISESGEIWHSPEATVEFLHSISEDAEPVSEGGETSDAGRTPTVLEQLDEKIEEVRTIVEKVETSVVSGDYITRPEAERLVSESIDELILPLNRRLDGED